MTVGVYDTASSLAVGQEGITEYANPYTPYQWYRIVAVMQKVTTNGLTNSAAFTTDGNVTYGAWFIYVN